ncbi:helix-turn-helix domain-containing protein [Christensenellaceae bacterium OttesenSCG-928-L17]|nr:helix-turn-helix domain-containing protein [Christensenellaceae bacterium OttesenSCG-928-L17]
MDYEKFIRERITALRLQENGLSESQLSYEIGRAHGYINSITSGRALPSRRALLAICERFSISPMAFFGQEQNAPALVDEIYGNIKTMSASDLEALAHIIDQMRKSQG